MSEQERTGWRDEEISKRHRNYGYNCPACDIDFLLLEYDSSSPCAIIEYKSHDSKENSFNKASYNAIVKLADAAKIPSFVVYYWKSIWCYKIFPLNGIAKNLMSRLSKNIVSEKEYVKFLYWIRNRKCDIDLSNLNDKVVNENVFIEVC